MSRARYVIPRRVRRGALKIVGHWSANPEDLVAGLETRIGFHAVGELADALGDKFGPDTASEFTNRLSEALAATVGPRVGETSAPMSAPLSARAAATNIAEAVLLAVPDVVFNSALETGYDIAVAYAFDLNRAAEAGAYVTENITQLFIDNGVPYGYDDQGHLVPTGSAVASGMTLQPALDVLDDSRLGHARTHLMEAQ